MRHRALFSRRGVQNLIVLSILGERKSGMEAPTLLPLLLLLAVKMGASSSPWATSSPAATTSPGATATSSPFYCSATTGRRWFSGTGRATRQPSPPNGQASGSLHPLLSLLAIYGRYACFRKMEMQGKLYKQLPSYERSNKTSKLQKFLMEQANCQDRKLKAAKEAFDASIDCGITFFVTAEVYGAGISGAINSESLLGRFIKERQRKEQVEVAIATKFAALPWSNSSSRRTGKQESSSHEGSSEDEPDDDNDEPAKKDVAKPWVLLPKMV
ncbi:uncharacterized protein LOC120658377 isoform X3 [Panicum virgatum]|nr:uncharacterized protein LOC120658377 isoform X3 [Panicum virgatum]